VRQGLDEPVFAAGCRPRAVVCAVDGDVAQRAGGEQIGQLAVCGPPGLFGVGAWRGSQAQQQFGGCRLLDLEQGDPREPVEPAGECQRGERDGAAGRGGKGEQVGCAALDLDRGQRVTAG